jgi:DNA-directed RNA polymerase specialized sigma24 family protein
MTSDGDSPRSAPGVEEVLRALGPLATSILGPFGPEQFGVSMGELSEGVRRRLTAVLDDRTPGRPASYIHGAVAVAFIEAMRRVRDGRDARAAEGNDVHQAGAEAELLRREIAWTIERATATLAADEGRAVRLRLLGMSVGEIGLVLAWSAADVERRLNAGLAGLRAALAAEGIELAAAE